MVTLLSACATGPRPTLGPATTLAPVTDPAINSVIDALSEQPSSSFTVTYDVTAKFGGLSASAEVSFDPERGTAVLIDKTLYLVRSDSSTITCTWSEQDLSASDCTPGIDEARVSYLQLNSRVFKEAIIDRLRRDSQVASGESATREATVAGRTATCADVPVIDSAGSQQTKSYCAFEDLGVIASLDTGDLSIAAVFVDDVVTTTLFDSAGNDG